MPHGADPLLKKIMTYLDSKEYISVKFPSKSIEIVKTPSIQNESAEVLYRK